MKKIILTALIIMVSASFITADAKAKKDKNKDMEIPVPVTAADSLSYIAGMQQTDGLTIFLKQQHHVDSADYADFVRGFRDAMSREYDDAQNAYITGMMVAGMLSRNLLPRMRDMVAAQEDSVFNKEMFVEGFAAAVMGDELIPDSMARRLFDDAVALKTKKDNDATIKEGETFLAENKTKEGVVTTGSGLQYKVLVKGDGDIPTTSDEVTVRYEGRLINGTVFDSSYKRKDGTAKFRPDKVIKGWTEALTMMPVGSKWELYIPYNLAYGDRKSGSIPPYSTLIFTVELVGF